VGAGTVAARRAAGRRVQPTARIIYPVERAIRDGWYIDNGAAVFCEYPWRQVDWLCYSHLSESLQTCRLAVTHTVSCVDLEDMHMLTYIQIEQNIDGGRVD
jgi:hypothetical protein